MGKIMNLNNLIGNKYNRLTIIRIWRNNKSEIRCDCVCDCNKEIEIKNMLLSALKSNNTKSCGCLGRERTIAFNKKQKTKYNKYDLSGEFGIGYSNNNKGEFYFDLEDYDLIKVHSWLITRTGYVYTSLKQEFIENGKPKREHIHHLIMPEKEGFFVDHIDRNPLNNKRNNLRYATISQNNMNVKKRKDNTTGIKGVVLNQSKNWNARIDKEGKRYNLGTYSDKKDAIVARLLGEKELFGEFAPQRHLFKEYGIEE